MKSCNKDLDKNHMNRCKVFQKIKYKLACTRPGLIVINNILYVHAGLSPIFFHVMEEKVYSKYKKYSFDKIQDINDIIRKLITGHISKKDNYLITNELNLIQYNNEIYNYGNRNKKTLYENIILDNEFYTNNDMTSFIVKDTDIKNDDYNMTSPLWNRYFYKNNTYKDISILFNKYNITNMIIAHNISPTKKIEKLYNGIIYNVDISASRGYGNHTQHFEVLSIKRDNNNNNIFNRKTIFTDVNNNNNKIINNIDHEYMLPIYNINKNIICDNKNNNDNENIYYGKCFEKI
jgi:hypothetical protein